MKLKGPAAKIFKFSEKDQGVPSSFANTNQNVGKVPFSHQKHVNLCGDACLNMMFGAHDRPQTDLSKNPRGTFQGLNTSNILQKINQNGLQPSLPESKPSNNQWKEQDLSNELGKNGPAICGLSSMGGRSGHYVVLLEAKDSNVLVHDPWKGPNQTMPLTDFNKRLDWQDPYNMIFAKKTEQNNSSVGY